MATFDDFEKLPEEQPSATLEDFGTELKPLRNDAIAANRGVQGALKDGGSIPSYVGGEADADLDNANLDEELKLTAGNAEQAVVNVLSDTTIPDDDRARLVEKLRFEPEEILNRHVQTHNALVARGYESETLLDEESAFNAAEVIGEAYQQIQQEEALITEWLHKNAEDSTTLDKIADFGGMIVPLMDGKVVRDIQKGLEEQGIMPEDGKYWGAFLANGFAKAEIAEAIQATEDGPTRMKMVESVLNLIDENSALFGADENTLRKAQFAQEMLRTGDYGTGAQWFDTIVGLLDVSIIGGAAGRILKGGAAAGKGAKIAGATRQAVKEVVGDKAYNAVARKVNKKMTVEQVRENSAKAIAERANPEVARNIHERSMIDIDGNDVRAMSGATAEDVAARDLLPDMLDDEVRHTASNLDLYHKEDMLVDDDVIVYTRENADVNFGNDELVQRSARQVRDFESVTSMRIRENQTQVGLDGDDYVVSAVYGPNSNGAWTNPLDALDQAERALGSAEGVTYELMKLGRNGKYKKVEKIREKAKGNYLVRAKRTFKDNPTASPMVARDGFVNIAARAFEKTVAGNGVFKDQQIINHLLDDASRLDTEVTGGAFRAADVAGEIEARMGNLAKPVVEGMQNLKRDQLLKVNHYIREANHKGIGFDEVRLAADGFDDDAIEVLRGWKKYWDTSYVLENDDLIKSLKAGGFKKVISGDTELFAKPIKKGSVTFDKGTVAVLDPELDELVVMSRTQLDELYEAGGTIAESKMPVDMAIGSERVSVNAILVRNPTDNRAFKELQLGDTALNYRQGYYHVAYNGRHFAEEVIRNREGVEIGRKTIANSDSLADMNAYKARNAGTEIEVVTKEAGVEFGSQAYMGLQQSRGRLNQRRRGQRLENANAVSSSADSHIADPVETLIQSTKSMSRRVATRDWIEKSKARWLEQYGHVNDGNWPATLGEMQRGRNNLDDFVDARQAYSYIKMMESGYVSSIGDTVKGMVNRMADIAGGKGMRKTESAFQKAASVKPLSSARGLAFNAYLATAPARQLVIQTHQALQLGAIEPAYTFGGALVRETSGMLMYAAGHTKQAAKTFGVSEKEMDVIWKHWKDSGLGSSIDRHVLTDGALNQLADYAHGRGILGTAGNVGAKGVKALRKVGFDAGEYANQLTGWLAFRHRAIKNGKTMSKASTRNAVAAGSRNFTYGMNFAGDMPYNTGVLGTVLQFMSVPHKSMMMMLSNRFLTKQERARLAAFNLTMYGVPASMMFESVAPLISDLPEELQDAIVFGLEDVMLNSMINVMMGEAPLDREGAIDFSSLAPINVAGMYELFASAMTTDASEYMAKSPAGALFAGHNPRIKDFLWELGNLVNPETEYEEGDLGATIKAFAGISSGFSAAFKAHYAWEHGKTISSTGKVLDEDVNGAQAIAKLFGLGTREEWYDRTIKKELYEDSKFMASDVREWYNQLKRQLTRRDVTPQEQQFYIKVLSEAWHVFGRDKQKAYTEVQKLIKKDMLDGDLSLFRSLQGAIGIQDSGKLRNIIKMADMPEQNKGLLLESIDTLEATAKVEAEGMFKQ